MNALDLKLCDDLEVDFGEKRVLQAKFWRSL